MRCRSRTRGSKRCIWTGLDALFAQVGAALAGPSHGDGRYTVNPFPLLAMPCDAQTQLRAAQRWAAAHAPPAPVRRPKPTMRAGTRLRIGFASADIREHPMMHLQIEHWERIDRARIETFGYGLRATDPGPIGRRAARAFEHFADVSAESTEQIHRRIRADGIAILFDLNGYTAGGDSRLMGLRPAPIQINSIGFPGTLGTDWHDYILVDHFGAPEAMQPFYTERLWHMPHASYPSDTTRAPQGPPPSRAECGLPEQGFVFCCFNKSCKILPAVFAIWMRLLHAVPGSVLWLLASEAEVTANLRREAAAAGIDPARLIFAPKVPQERHLARREALALRLAREPQTLAGFRARLAANRRTHPLFDMARYTRDFEDGLQAIWRDFLVQQSRMSSA
jgi:protein O-GlcNAc transferase